MCSIPRHPERNSHKLSRLRRRSRSSTLQQREPLFALGSFKKADKQDEGHCVACQKQMIKYGMELGDWKTAEQGAEEMIAESKDETARVRAHIQFAVVFYQEGLHKQKAEYFSRANDEASKALAAHPNFLMPCTSTDSLWLRATRRRCQSQV
jgi:hypothetical protein